MTINEWNKVLKHAEALNSDTIRTSVYSMYDGKKGIRISKLDSRGDEVAYRNTGVHSDKEDYIEALNFYAYLLNEEDAELW